MYTIIISNLINLHQVSCHQHSTISHHLFNEFNIKYFRDWMVVDLNT
jgi:hypothetical protein